MDGFTEIMQFFPNPHSGERDIVDRAIIMSFLERTFHIDINMEERLKRFPCFSCFSCNMKNMDCVFHVSSNMKMIEKRPNMQSGFQV